MISMSVETRRITFVALVVAAVCLPTGFFVGRAGDDADGGSETPTVPKVNLGRDGRYVALGDSYSAGEGLPDYDPATDDLPAGDRCHRSPTWSYPALLQFVWQTELVHRACSGAIVSNVFDTVQTHSGTPNVQGHQVEAETFAGDVVLVTLTMGGNDLRFADMLIFCAKHTNCLGDTFDQGKPLESWANDHLDSIQTDLTDMYAKLRDAAPADARILVLGYPGLFPETVPPLFADPFCHEVMSVWGQSEREAIRAWNVQLNEAVREAAQASGIEYVDIYSYFSQHEVCGSAGAWIKFVGDPSRVERDGWFHPTRTGQGMMARILACYLHVYASAQEASQADATHLFELSSCVADRYPTEGANPPVSVPTFESVP